jgi:RimJ/RimL family protein N-acetyltransferase
MNTMSHCIIRKLNRDDAETWAAIRREALEAHPLAFSASVPDDREAWIESIRLRLGTDEESAIFGAFNGASLVGIVGVVRNTGNKERHKSIIWGMYVTAGFRRSGVGERLMRTAIDEACSWPGVEQIHLAVSEAAADAKRLYEKIGFRAWGLAPRALCWDGRCVDETHMVLDLRGR